MSCAHTDAHSIGVDTIGLTDLIECDEYSECEQCYVLLQQKLLELLFEKYGVEGEKKDVTTDDRICRS